jgi:4-hydroxy-4-methyl-2-oxoglutarate aldolase
LVSSDLPFCDGIFSGPSSLILSSGRRPVWASDITPVTGKWRIETVEINGPVQIGAVRVAAGDLVVADDTGVCFIPRDVVLEVLDAAEQKAKAETVRCKAIDDGVPVPDIARATYGEK